MKKQLGIITLSSEVGKSYEKTLSAILGSNVSIHRFSFEDKVFENEDKIKLLKSLDSILISTRTQHEILKKYLDTDFNIIISKLSITKKAHDILTKLSQTNKNRVLLVNLSLEMCLETISLFYQLGFNDIEFVPVYPQMKHVPEGNIAVTTGESRYVPRGIKEVYDLGHRILEGSTLFEVILSLGMEEKLMSPATNEYLNSIVNNNLGMNYLLSKSNSLQSQLDILLHEMDKGVIYVDKNNLISSCNGIAEKLVQKSKGELLGKKANLILPQINFNIADQTNALVEIENKYINISTHLIKDNEGRANGSYAIMEDFEKKEASQNKLKLQLLKRGHRAKYNLDDIIGESPSIKNLKDIIRQMGPSNSSVLITGESGTGKEIIAQALHNLSYVSNRQFVAINCAAFNPSLLESELFGYEAGAFTGASKKGKRGIFEMASNGTLFLDEIGEIPLELQAKLLRVIQEKEVMRVGGDEVIKINPRIISATNLDLQEEIRKGNFRSDLYYRLNVLPINVPPLRKRKGDIELLLKHFMRINKSTFKFNTDTLNYLNNYPWRGNVRELINCIEYLSHLKKDIIQINDLPYYMREQFKSNLTHDVEINFDNSEALIVLSIMYKAYLNKEKVGRRSISKIAFEQKYQLSEYDVQAIMNELESKDLIVIKKGRGGSVITKKGVEYMESVNGVNGCF